MCYKNVVAVLFLVILSSCCCGSGDIGSVADKHEEKLRQHFISGGVLSDISTLIAETRDISARLKRDSLKKRANKFDSYIDVLTYGNNTIEESLKDVMELIQGRGGSGGKCPTFRGLFKRAFCCK